LQRKTAKVTKDISGKNEQQAEEDLAALRDAALKSKVDHGSYIIDTLMFSYNIQYVISCFQITIIRVVISH